MNQGWRFNIDPYLKLYDKNKNLHTIKTRFYRVTNESISDSTQDNSSAVLYADYQFQHKWSKGTAITAGATAIRNIATSALFGDHYANNFAVYGQFDKRFFDKLDLTGGIRLEYYDQDGIRGDSDYYFGQDSTVKIPVFPILRVGAHYQVAKYSHFRASFGQGVRYPSVAERYTKTALGDLNVFPNPGLIPETGWAAEVGFKQAVKIGKKWKGLIDVAGFINQYNNMMEFQFGVFDPRDNARLDPNGASYDSIVGHLLLNEGFTVTDLFGFSAVNAESARITGAEISFNSQGEIGDVQLTSLLGYTYMNPISLNADSAYRSTFSDTTTNMLKYRFNHMVKADIEATWKGISLGFSVRYNSYMTNIDQIFLDEIVNGIYILPGLADYRERFSRGDLVFDARVGYSFAKHYRVGFVVNNVFNREYVTRPGDVQAPRNFVLQLQMKF